MNWIVQSVQRMMCGLHGHDALLLFERHRVSLRCVNCGYQTAGWMLQPETRHAEPLAADVSHVHASGFGRLQRILEATRARRLSRCGPRADIAAHCTCDGSDTSPALGWNQLLGRYSRR